MSDFQMAFALTVTICMVVSAAGVTLWLLWSLFWDLYDHYMQNRFRIKNERLYECKPGAFMVSRYMSDAK